MPDNVASNSFQINTNKSNKYLMVATLCARTVLGAINMAKKNSLTSLIMNRDISVIRQAAMEVPSPFHHFLILLLDVNILLHSSLGHYRILTLSHQLL